jgi:hypothetical protein
VNYAMLPWQVRPQMNERLNTTLNQMSKIVKCKPLNEEGLPYSYRCSLNYEISDLRDFKKRKEYPSNNIFFKHAEFFLMGIRAQRDEDEGRILLGVNTSGRTVMLLPIRF